MCPLIKSPLIEPRTLASRLGAPDLRIADVRWQLGAPEAGRRDFAAGHIPGSVFVDLETDLRSTTGPARHALPSVPVFLQRMEALGFGREQTIVVVDDANGAIASRLWWMLDDLGHPDVRVLSGGLATWRDLSLPWTTEPTAAATPGSLHGLRESWTHVVTIDEVGGPGRQGRLLDARAPERYRGDVEPIDPAAGHIPGALNLPFVNTLDEHGRLLPPEQLREVLGITAGTADTVYCGSGVTACLLALAYRHAGLPRPKLYAGSWSEWSGSSGAVETGDGG